MDEKERQLQEIIENQRYDKTEEFLPHAENLAMQESGVYDTDRIEIWFSILWYDWVRGN